MDSPEGETPQTERTLQTSQDSENGFPRRGDPTDRKSLHKISPDTQKQDQTPQNKTRQTKTSPDTPKQVTTHNTSPDILKLKKYYKTHKIYAAKFQGRDFGGEKKRLRQDHRPRVAGSDPEIYEQLTHITCIGSTHVNLKS